jgi:hypothetical protein
MKFCEYDPLHPVFGMFYGMVSPNSHHMDGTSVMRHHGRRRTRIGDEVWQLVDGHVDFRHGRRVVNLRDGVAELCRQRRRLQQLLERDLRRAV